MTYTYHIKGKGVQQMYANKTEEMMDELSTFYARLKEFGVDGEKIELMSIMLDTDISNHNWTMKTPRAYIRIFDKGIAREFKANAIHTQTDEDTNRYMLNFKGIEIITFMWDIPF